MRVTIIQRWSQFRPISHHEAIPNGSARPPSTRAFRRRGQSRECPFLVGATNPPEAICERPGEARVARRTITSHVTSAIKLSGGGLPSRAAGLAEAQTKRPTSSPPREFSLHKLRRQETHAGAWKRTLGSTEDHRPPKRRPKSNRDDIGQHLATLLNLRGG